MRKTWPRKRCYAYRKFRDLRKPEQFRSWIVRIAFRLALDRWRSAKRREVRETAINAPNEARSYDYRILTPLEESTKGIVRDAPNMPRVVEGRCKHLDWRLPSA
jgi:DNA-directed RNA polymerase specialized sigma24 family protein